MTETQVKPQLYTTATVPLRSEHLHQPALCDPLFPGRVYFLPAATEGQLVRVYDADEWQQYNGREGTVRRYSFFTGVYTVAVDNVYERPFYGREIMKVR